MKKTVFIIFKVLISMVLLGKISSWFLQYGNETNQLLNTAMFMLIGIAYLVAGFLFQKKLTKIIFLLCGAYLIVMNFVGYFGLQSMIGIFCILAPMLLIRFFPEKPNEIEEA